jgi:CheY-like chemotaxis protein
MLKLENIHNVTLAKDGQEAYDIVKSNMDKAIVYDLIFMDIQVRNGHFTGLYHVPTRLLDAEYGRFTKHTSYSPVGIFRTNCCINGIRGRK